MQLHVWLATSAAYWDHACPTTEIKGYVFTLIIKTFGTFPASPRANPWTIPSWYFQEKFTLSFYIFTAQA
jgi:hypothetical protein